MISKLPTVDVVVPVYNPGPYFLTTMASLLLQDYESFRVIIVDDCSTHGLDLLEKFRSHANVEILRTSHNSGGGDARNVGVEHATAEYVAFCDSDDIWPANKLNRQIDFMTSNGYDMSHSDISIQRGDSIFIVKTGDQIGCWDFLTKTELYCSTVCLKTSIGKLYRFGTFRKRHPFKFWISILEAGNVSYRCKDFTVGYVVRADSVSSAKFRTLFYTFVAYAVFPKNKVRSVGGLLIRAYNSFAKQSRITGVSR